MVTLFVRKSDRLLFLLTAFCCCANVFICATRRRVRFRPSGKLLQGADSFNHS